MTATAARIDVRGTLDYDGPRPPPIVVEPAMDNPSGGQTVVFVHAVGKDGRPYEMQLSSPPTIPDPDGKPAKVSFVTVPKEKRASGTFPLAPGDLRAHFRKHWPKQFEDAPPPVYVQMKHAPTDRGNLRGPLDAWTGTLHTKVVPVPKLVKW